MPIRYVPYQQIDLQKWDACVAGATNGLVYAQSNYLTAMAANWDALVLDDYAAVMPLTWKKKYGIYYLYQPFFAACLGIFGSDVDASLFRSFLEQVPAKFRYWDIYVNHANVYALADFPLYHRTNFVLNLELPYQDLYQQYRDNTKRNIKKAAQLNCTISTHIPIESVIALAMQQSASFSPITANDYDRFRILYLQMATEQKAITYGVYSNQQLVASAAFIFSHNRAYYILVGNHPNGKTIGASHALMDAFIKDHANQPLLLDFEGSDLRNLAFFYSSFGAVEEHYAGLKINRLPWWAKWLKQ